MSRNQPDRHAGALRNVETVGSLTIKASTAGRRRYFVVRRNGTLAGERAGLKAARQLANSMLTKRK
jgi:hypothetical protein